MELLLWCKYRALPTTVILLEKPTWTTASSFLFLLFCPRQTTDILLEITDSWTPVFLRYSFAFHLPGPAWLYNVLCINQKHQWDQYQDWPALPVWIQYSRKFANSFSSLPLVPHSRTLMKGPGLAAALLLLTVCTKPFADFLSIVCVSDQFKLEQSSAPLSKFSCLCVCVCVSVGGGQFFALRFLSEDCDKQIRPRGRQ